MDEYYDIGLVEEPAAGYVVDVWDDHPMMTTSFSEYSVVEGLLLLIFLVLFLQFFLNLFRRWF